MLFEYKLVVPFCTGLKLSLPREGGVSRLGVFPEEVIELKANDLVLEEGRENAGRVAFCLRESMELDGVLASAAMPTCWGLLIEPTTFAANSSLVLVIGKVFAISDSLVGGVGSVCVGAVVAVRGGEEYELVVVESIGAAVPTIFIPRKIHTVRICERL
jgi:hypothetical protein